ncbi:ATP-binding cassette domain-containing protein [Skermanella stibiiresistens]|uniref:ATP-binding cassette domain-containing protein n=1 Tax=Skermanella stibiiresistens TaxID=913326 RepID=UPI0004B21586|nr:ATP-binding cassette domain-containing protein [Skermanella stibiiresistens]
MSADRRGPDEPRSEHRLELDRVGLALDGRQLIAPLSLVIEGGRVAVLMGPSGSGKSSLLAHLCGTLPPQFEAAGRVTLDGADLTDLPPERRRVGILFQDDLLFPHMSVAENLAFGLVSRVRGRAERRAVVERALADADLAGFGGRDPATLSGGQRARVALMRALLAEPAALLLDEPFGKLDAALRDRFRAWVFDHARRRGLPTLLVTHDPDDAREADRPVIQLA